jgi:hypothetical protein
MFSNITDAWNHDPVKEMTDKLSRGAFRAETKNQRNSYENSSDTNQKNQFFNSKSTNLPNLKSTDLSNLKSTDLSNLKFTNLSSLTDGNSLSLLSENTIGLADSDFGSYTPINFSKDFDKKKSKNKQSKYINSESSDSNINIGSSDNFNCNYSIKHLKNCDRCNDKIKKLINSKVNKKFDEIILDNKIKQLQNMVGPQIQQNQPLVSTNTNNDSWKETLIIIVGAVIIIFFIFLMAKALYK